MLVFPCFAEPPFSGTIFMDPDIITREDETTFVDSMPVGEGFRQVFDRRINQWVNLNLHLFRLRFKDGLAGGSGKRWRIHFRSCSQYSISGRYRCYVFGAFGRRPQERSNQSGVIRYGGANRNESIGFTRPESSVSLAAPAEGFIFSRFYRVRELVNTLAE